MYTKWIYKNTDNISDDLKNLKEDELIVKLLAQRGIDTKKRLDDFLNPLKMPIISPYKFLTLLMPNEHSFTIFASEEGTVETNSLLLITISMYVSFMRTPS